eukprot:8508466-Pyramimonas_sp.AAC.1
MIPRAWAVFALIPALEASPPSLQCHRLWIHARAAINVDKADSKPVIFCYLSVFDHVAVDVGSGVERQARLLARARGKASILVY